MDLRLESAEVGNRSGRTMGWPLALVPFVVLSGGTRQATHLEVALAKSVVKRSELQSARCPIQELTNSAMQVPAPPAAGVRWLPFTKDPRTHARICICPRGCRSPC